MAKEKIVVIDDSPIVRKLAELASKKRAIRYTRQKTEKRGCGFPRRYDLQ